MDLKAEEHGLHLLNKCGVTYSSSVYFIHIFVAMVSILYYMKMRHFPKLLMFKKYN